MTQPSFLEEASTAGVFWSGGMESTLLLLLCIEKYGKDNVHAFTQKFVYADNRQVGMRNYDTFAAAIAEVIGFNNHHIVEISPETGPFNMLRLETYDEAINIVPDLDVLYAGINQIEFGKMDDATIQQMLVEPFKDKTLLKTPFVDMAKTDTVNMYYQYGFEQILPMTRSCHKLTQNHCGRCDNCRERKFAFTEAGRTDPTIYLG